MKRATASGEEADGDGVKQTPARPGDAAAVVAAAAGLAPGVESINSLLPNGAGDLGVDAETASTPGASTRRRRRARGARGGDARGGEEPAGGDKGFDKGFDKSDKSAGEKKEAGGNNKTLSLDGIPGSKRADGEGTVKERKRPRVKDALAELAQLAPEGEEASQSESDHSSADACAKRAALGWPAEDPRHDPTNEVERVLRAQIASRVGVEPRVDEDAADDAFARETEALRAGLSAESIAPPGRRARAFTRGRERAIGFMFETCRAEHPIDALARRTRAPTGGARRLRGRRSGRRRGRSGGRGKTKTRRREQPAMNTAGKTTTRGRGRGSPSESLVHGERLHERGRRGGSGRGGRGRGERCGDERVVSGAPRSRRSRTRRASRSPTISPPNLRAAPRPAGAGEGRPDRWPSDHAREGASPRPERGAPRGRRRAPRDARRVRPRDRRRVPRAPESVALVGFLGFEPEPGPDGRKRFLIRNSR